MIYTFYSDREKNGMLAGRGVKIKIKELKVVADWQT